MNVICVMKYTVFSIKFCKYGGKEVKIRTSIFSKEDMESILLISIINHRDVNESAGKSRERERGMTPPFHWRTKFY